MIVAQIPAPGGTACRECAVKFWEINGTMPDSKLTAFFEMFHQVHAPLLVLP